MIVLSRKGVDSSSGEKGFSLRDGREVSPNIPDSLILSDGRMLSIPIPEVVSSGGEKRLNTDSGITYGDFLSTLKGGIHEDDYSYLEGYLKNVKEAYLHNDPDIQRLASVSSREKATFGIGHNPMVSAVLKGLLARGEKVEDLLFLFFGRFKHIEPPESGDGDPVKEIPFHAIWGFMKPESCLFIGSAEELEKILKETSRNVGVPYSDSLASELGISLGEKSLFPRHPHCQESYQSDGKFIFYTGDQKRYGVFRYNQELLRLTVPGEESLSKWRPDVLPWFRSISANMAPFYVKAVVDHIDTHSGQWQEAVALSQRLGKNCCDEEKTWRKEIERLISDPRLGVF